VSTAPGKHQKTRCDPHWYDAIDPKVYLNNLEFGNRVHITYFRSPRRNTASQCHRQKSKMVAFAPLIALFTTATLTLANPVSITSIDAPLETVRLTPCATVRCAAGYTCQAIGNRARCVPNKPEGRRQCGASICATGLTCCNASCGICTPPGVMCTQQVCDKPEPIPEPKPVPTEPAPGKGLGPKCGGGRCDAGNVCCNDSCGICTPPGGACIQLFCGKKQ
jgi:hypothetical protein